jgi:hypothetical protein
MYMCRTVWHYVLRDHNPIIKLIKDLCSMEVIDHRLNSFPNCVHVVVSEGAFCGNKIVEAGEECDCGYDEEECTDKCCYPRLLTEKDKQNSSATSCARKANTQCRYGACLLV